jgi:hypothetical protein
MSPELDLFGMPVQKPQKLMSDYAHPAKPGTGPAGETCGNCAHCFRRRRGRSYYKCEKIRKNWTFGPGSDLRLKDPACLFFKQRLES